jgi:serine/threonine protein kinase
MQIKQSQLRDFEVLAKIGEGAYGQVFKVKRKVDGLIYAIKKVMKKEYR